MLEATHRAAGPRLPLQASTRPSTVADLLADCVLLPGGAGAARRETEAFIRQVFSEQHGATIESYMPVLWELRDRHGVLLAAAGSRGGCSGRLFLEHYLDAPIERILAERTGRRVARRAIVEVGHLASRGAGSAAALFRLLAPRLAAQRYLWTVFTATRAVRRVFEGLGIALLELADADPCRLGSAAAHWGRYYQQSPRVVAGYIPTGAPRLRGAATT